MFSKQRLSIDIKGHIIKLVQGELSGSNTIKVERSAYIDVKGAVLRDGKLVNCQQNVEMFKNFLVKHRFNAEKVYLNISDSKVITRVINLPKIPLNDLDDLINVEMPKYFPIDLSRFYIDYKILTTYIEDEKTFFKILLCAVPRDIVREYVDLLIACDLKPILVDVQPNSISRIFQSIQYEDIAVIDGGIETADLLILDRGHFYIYTTIDFEIPDYTELYRNPKEYDANVLEEQIQKLSKNVQNYIEFFLTTNEGKKIDRIYLTGDLAMIDGLDERLMDDLDITVIKGFKDFVTVKKPKKNADLNENFICGNIGIMLRGV